MILVLAQAQAAGEPCDSFGQAVVADDKKSVLACPPLAYPITCARSLNAVPYHLVSYIVRVLLILPSGVLLDETQMLMSLR